METYTEWGASSHCSRKFSSSGFWELYCVGLFLFIMAGDLLDSTQHAYVCTVKVRLAVVSVCSLESCRLYRSGGQLTFRKELCIIVQPANHQDFISTLFRQYIYLILPWPGDKVELEKQVTSNHLDLSAQETEGSVLHSSAAGDDSMRHRG